MKKKCVALALSFILLVSICCPIYATELTEVSMEIHSAVEDVVKREYDTVEIVNDEEWIQLDDVAGNSYAFFVPLKSNNVISGYSVASYLDGRIIVLKTASGEKAAYLATTIIQLASNSDVARIIYEFPDAFLADYYGTYYKICITGDLELVDAEDYTRVDSNYLRTISSDYESEIQPREEIVYGVLSDSTIGRFVPIPKENGGYYYGGYQAWLTDEGVSKFFADRSCGVTAAANMMYYMATHDPGKAALYTQNGLTKSKFSSFQRTLYNYLTPSLAGIPTATNMISGIRDYARSRGVTLTLMTSPTNWTHSTVLNYMKTGLNVNSPVLMLNWNSPIPDLVAHWVTVTRIYGDNVSMYMVASTWGEQVTYDFNTWVNGSSVYKSVFYFV